MPSCVAVLTATGAISTAVAVLEMNRPITAVTANRQARMALGPAPPSTLTRPPTARSMPPVDGAVVALLIGELHYMNGLNRMSTAIVEHAVALWRAQSGGVLICEAAPMVAVARGLGVPEERIRIAIPEPAGHTTRWAAERIRGMADVAGRRTALPRRAARDFQ